MRARVRTPAPTGGGGGRHLAGLDVARIVGALLVFATHFVSDLVPSLAGVSGATKMLLATPVPRAIVLWVGPAGVSIFVAATGMVLPGAFARAGREYREFVKRRLARLLPLYWWVAVPLLALALIVGRMSAADLWKVPLWLSGAGILGTGLFYPLIDGWWYVTLALQLVLVFPVVYALVRKAGYGWALVGAAVVSVAAVRLLAPTQGYWHLAIGLFVSRLFEFVAGIVAIETYRMRSRLRGAVLAYAAAAAIVLLASGPSRPFFAAAVVGVSFASVLLFAGDALGFAHWPRLAFASSLTYSFYLSHSPWAKTVLRLIPPTSTAAIAVAAAGSLAVSVVVALAFQLSFERAALVVNAASRRGVPQPVSYAPEHDSRP